MDHLRPSSRDHQMRELPSLKRTHSEDGRQSLPVLEPISRPSSTSTQNSSIHHSASLPQLPGLSALASIASSSGQPQLRGFNVGPGGMGFSTSSPSATSVGGGLGNSPPTCQNCTTSTTPLWRRDEIGSVLCNACGLFLKLHGRPRPISLKTDVIKSRNRVKSSGSGGPQGAKKKSVFDINGLEQSRSQAGTPPPGTLGHRRTSQKSANGHSDGSNSPISRTATPSMFQNHLPPFNGHGLEEHYNHSPSLPPMHLRQPSPGRSTSPLNGSGLEVPQTYEQLIANNSALKTRVSELEVINELFRGRVTQLEQDEANARRGEDMRREAELSLSHQLENSQLRLEESQRRENQLKRRLDDVERELSELKDGAPRAKKMRVSEMVEMDSSTPPSTS